ncbi:putative hydroxymethylpyrimidine transport system ATP-binding protein [Alkalicoccus daliensis]|uniref:Putative hydroxymethylpyrimidine transport system ATP-binding protein n=2 Tax=Alkalicoccus daliensis TaxID=745820 RepID=A0A1H0JZH3_9BACI|nr:putative hydroxymethylpyrimidine transport system ATP-binding protein [Alkalicoccus daliensis]
MKNLHFQYGKEAIFEDLSLQVNQEEFVSVIGPSGSGKTTLFRLITGLEAPQQGEVLLQGKAVTSAGGRIGYMPQRDQLMPWRTILENVILPLELQGIRKKEACEKALPLLASFGLEGTEHSYPGELSGGMRQRVSFLRAYLTGAEVLLLDEPFSALDAITRLSMQEWLTAQWTKWKKTIIFITHDLDEALFLSDRVFVTSTPPMTSLKELQIPLARPRTMEDVNDPSLLQVKRELLRQFRAEGVL